MSCILSGLLGFIARDYNITRESGLSESWMMIRSFYFCLTGMCLLIVHLQNLHAFEIPLIQGTVIDSTSGVPIAGVRVTSQSGSSVETDSLGGFSLRTHQTGVITLVFTKTGYQTFSDRFLIEPSTNVSVTIKLYSSIGYKDEVIVTAAPPPEVERVEFVTPDYVVNAPGAFEDALHSLQTMPGVISGDDYSARLYVRGGRPDQNGIFMDGIPVYDPYRLFGLTSLFNPETIRDVRLYPGGFDVQYGDRLSAVIEVENRHGDLSRLFSGSANMSLTNANLIAEGRLFPGLPSSWLISGRRTYYDLIMNAVDDDTSSYPSFTDLQGIFYFQPDPNHEWLITTLRSDEGTDLTDEEEVVEDSDPNQFDAVDDQKNTILGLNGSHLFDGRMRLSYILSLTKNEQISDVTFLEGETGYESQFNQNLNNANTMLQTQFEAYLATHSIMAGMFYATSENTVFFDIATEDPRIEIPEELLHFAATQDFSKYGGFIKDAWEILPDLEWKTGVRWDRSTLSGMSEWSPRTSIRWEVSEHWKYRLAWGYYYQFPSYETLQGDGYFLDLRGIKALNLKPERAIHYVGSIEYEIPRGLSLETAFYYKDITDLLDSGEEQETVLILGDDNTEQWYTRDTLTWLPENSRTGYVRGVDLTLKLLDNPNRSYYGMVTYTYSEARSRESGEGYRYEDWDIRHNLSLIAGWVISPRWDIGWKWHLGSGFPYTPVTHIIRVVEDLDQDGRFEPENGETFTWQQDNPDSAENSKRLPFNHRLDLRIQYIRPFSKTEMTVYMDIINLYGSKNVMDYYYNADFTKRYEETGLPFLPSFGIKITY